MGKYERMVQKTMSKQVAAVVLGLASLPLYAQTTLNLPAQPLAATLVQLQRVSGVNIIAPSSVVAGRNAPALSGNLTIRQALGRLLEGTGLQVEEVNPNTFVIKGMPMAGDGKAAAAVAMTPSNAPAMVHITGQALGPEINARSSSTATRDNTPIAETPMSVLVVNKELIAMQQAKSVSESLGYLSGVTVQSAGGPQPQVLIRGRVADTKSNGISDAGISNSLGTPIAGIERVEVVKGGASILTGNSQAGGGIVNVNMKQPTAERVRELTAQVGNYGNFLSSIDLGGALSDDARLTYRFIASGERTDHSFGGYDGMENAYFAPSIGWKSGGSEIVLAYQHLYGSNPTRAATLLLKDGPVAYTERTTPAGSQRLKSDTVTLTYKQKFGSVFEFESLTQYQESNSVLRDNYAVGGAYMGMTYYTYQSGLTDNHSITSDNMVKAKFNTGEVQHAVVAGFSYSRFGFSFDNTQAGFFDVFPLPNGPTGPRGDVGNPYSGTQYFNNVYLQDKITWGRLHLSAGVGYGSAYGGALERQSEASPSFGALYEVTNNVNVYINSLKSFTQGTQALANNSIAPPSTTESVEAGAKATLMGGKLTVSGDVFRSKLNNYVLLDGATFLPMLADGALVYRGAELDVTGQLARGLLATFAYTYTHIDQPSGRDPRAMPYHTGSAWLNYDLQSEALRGWGGGIGVQARSAYYGTDNILTTDGHAKVPGGLKTDMTVYYHAPTWTATLGVKNLFDRTLYEQNGSARVGLLADRQIYLTGTYNF
jgi:iron complex outermembrane receptor protein